MSTSERSATARAVPKVKPSRYRSWLWTALLIPLLLLPYRWLWFPCGLAATLVVRPTRRSCRELFRRDETLIVGAPVVLILRTALDPGWWLPWIALLAVWIWLRSRAWWSARLSIIAMPLVWIASIGLLTRPFDWLLAPARTATSHPDVVLVCAGDSLTAGVNRRSDAETYVARLREQLGCRVINAGVANDTVSDLLARLDKDVLAHHPTAVLVFIGGNDYLGDTPRSRFAEQFDRLLSRIAASGARLIVVEVPSGIVWNPYAGVFRHAAARHGAVFVPESRLRWSLSVEFVARRWVRTPFTLDGIHLSPAGATQVADWLDPYVRRAIAAKPRH